MLDRRKIVFGSLSLHLRHLLALCKLICVASVDVWIAGIGTAEMLPNCCHLLAQHIVLFLQAARMVGILSEASIFLPQCFKLVLTGLDVITRFTENFPFAGLAAWGIGQDGVERVEQVLHLASSLAFSQLVHST